MSQPYRLSKQAANALRILAMDAVQQANSGHPGMPMGMADIAVALWANELCFTPKNPAWLNRDRFVLSNGHGSMLLYSLLHLTGFDLSLEDLRQFRQRGSKTPGHPEYGITQGVEVTTGPLGQGIANAVGMAIAEQHMAARFNRPHFKMIGHHTYAFLGDGCLMEGISHEACSLAGHLGLGKLVLLLDDNRISIDGPTNLSCSEDMTKRFEAYDWQVLQVDGHNQAEVLQALQQAKAHTKQPSLIRCRTTIGYGAPNKQDSAAVHGAPLGAKEIAAARKQLEWPHEPFYIPQELGDFWRQAGKRGAQREQEWLSQVQNYATAYPQQGKDLQQCIQNQVPRNWIPPLEVLLSKWKENAPKPMATRASSGLVLSTLSPHCPQLVGGSADLSESNQTRPPDMQDMSPQNPGGNYIRYGVREHAMGAIMNGLALHGGCVPYGGTFMAFSDYMRPAIRLAALMGLPVIYVFTHDSIGLGEDGPTHQPIEHLASLRAIPNLHVFRPADACETAECWCCALGSKSTPSALVLSRQALPNQNHTGHGGVERGGYVLEDSPPDMPLSAVLYATGSEVALALQARSLLLEQGIGTRVVSVPCHERFFAQTKAYQREVLAPHAKARVAIEAGVMQGWEPFVGEKGCMIGMQSYGGSAPAGELFEQFGFTPGAVVKAVESLLG